MIVIGHHYSAYFPQSVNLEVNRIGHPNYKSLVRPSAVVGLEGKDYPG
jgi:hypothetical protein